MGVMRFMVRPADRITDQMVEHAYLAGLDRIAWRAQVRRQGSELILERNASDSGNLHVLWEIEGYGLLTLSTGTLIEREEPYYLPLELARGKIGQVRNQAAELSMLGLEVPQSVMERLAEATRQFSEAAALARDSASSAHLAERALVLTVDAAYLLAAAYTEQVLALRRRAGNRIGTLMGADVGISPLEDYVAGQFLQTFNAACIPVVWREIEAAEGAYCWDLLDDQVRWCRDRGLVICLGPVMQLDARHLPDWLYAYERNFARLAEIACGFLEAVVSRYQGKVDLWIAAGRVNTADALALSEEENIRLTGRAVESLRSLDAETELLVAFDQPWAEYLRAGDRDFPPLHFADALVRAGLGLTGLGLEINVGYTPGGTLPRDPLEFSRQVDYWSLLGVPLYVLLTVPTAAHADPLAQRRASPLACEWSPAFQQTWVQRYVPLLLAKPAIRGIFWGQLRDSEPHALAHGGLFDLRRHPKPALRQFASIRQAHVR